MYKSRSQKVGAMTLDNHNLSVLKLKELNQLFQCSLCSGYIINATTIIDCCHIFCRSCIVKHLQSNFSCPKCRVRIPSDQIWTSITFDSTFQSLIYKVVPGLYRSEMKQQKEFLSNNSDSNKCNDLDKQEFYELSDKISILLVYFNSNNDKSLGVQTVNQNKLHPPSSSSSSSSPSPSPSPSTSVDKRYLLCPAGFSICSLKKFIKLKYELSSSYEVDILYEDNILTDNLLLIDVVYIYSKVSHLFLLLVFIFSLFLFLSRSSVSFVSSIIFIISKGIPDHPLSSSSLNLSLSL